MLTFTIHREQFVALAPRGPGSFLERAARHLQQEFPGRFAAKGEESSHEVAMHRVRVWWSRARALCETCSEHEVVLFSQMTLRHGEEFERQPWAEATLNDSDVDAFAERLHRLDTQLRVREELQLRNRELRALMLGHDASAPAGTRPVK